MKYKIINCIFILMSIVFTFPCATISDCKNLALWTKSRMAFIRVVQESISFSLTSNFTPVWDSLEFFNISSIFLAASSIARSIAKSSCSKASAASASGVNELPRLLAVFSSLLSFSRISSYVPLNYKIQSFRKLKMYILKFKDLTYSFLKGNI